MTIFGPDSVYATLTESEQLRYLTDLVSDDYYFANYNNGLESTFIGRFMYHRSTRAEFLAREICDRMGQNKSVEKTMDCNWCSEELEYNEINIHALYSHRSSEYECLEVGGEDFMRALEFQNIVCLCGDCSNAVVYCNDCNVLTDSDNGCSDPNGYTVCQTCYDDNYEYCYEHEETYSQNAGCYYCREDNGRLIHDYSYTEDPKFFMKGGLFSFIEPARTSVTGFELEMEAINCDRDEGAQLASDLFGDVSYLKYDGSLEDGFELVTHPLSRDYVRDNFNFDAMRELARFGMRSAQTSSCGLHVHINKGFFDGRPTSFYRFMALFYRNKPQWRRLAGREESGYAKWDDGQEDSMLNYTKGMATRDPYSRNADRYVALNLQPRHTIEMRFFRGTLRPATLKARVEAIHAVAEYSVATRNKVNIKASSDWEMFREFARTNGYDAFTTYADEKGV